MNISDYSRRASATKIFPEIKGTIIYPVLGLVGEAGEVAEKVKKMYRNDNGEMSAEFKTSLAKELGDVLWYINALADELGLTLEEIAEMNLDKVERRLEEGTIASSGDDR